MSKSILYSRKKKKVKKKEERRWCKAAKTILSMICKTVGKPMREATIIGHVCVYYIIQLSLATHRSELSLRGHNAIDLKTSLQIESLHCLKHFTISSNRFYCEINIVRKTEKNKKNKKKKKRKKDI